MNENQQPETEVRPQEFEAYTETLNIVRDLVEHRRKFTPRRKRIRAERHIKRKLPGNMDIEDFDGIELTNFFNGLKCIARATGKLDCYTLEWPHGKRSFSTRRDILLSYGRE